MCVDVVWMWCGCGVDVVCGVFVVWMWCGVDAWYLGVLDVEVQSSPGSERQSCVGAEGLVFSPSQSDLDHYVP